MQHSSVSERYNDDLLRAATARNQIADDERLIQLSRVEALKLPAESRLRWFHLVKSEHPNLLRVFDQVRELLDPHIEINIIPIVGMTGVGKTTFSEALVPTIRSAIGEVPVGEVPVIHLEVKSIGEARISWRVLYHDILSAAGETEIERRITIDTSSPRELRYGNKMKWITELFFSLKPFFERRNVRVLILDEAVHLLRYDEYKRVMDTLKTLANMMNIKLILIGSYDIEELVGSYAQVIRRQRMVHFQRYKVGADPKGGELKSEDQHGFCQALQLFQDNWPSKMVPNLMGNWYQWMFQSLGSVGLLKQSLMPLALFQLRDPQLKLTTEMLTKCFLPWSARNKIEEETQLGELKIRGFCYGDCSLDKKTLTGMISLNKVSA